MEPKVPAIERKIVNDICKAGVLLFFKHGYAGLDLRAVAVAAGISETSLYDYFPTKQELLFAVIRNHLKDLLEGVAKGLEGTQEPIERMRAFILFQATYYKRNEKEVYVRNVGLSSLTPENYAQAIGLWRAYERVLNEIVDDGVAQGLFKPVDTRMTTFAILNIIDGIGVGCESDSDLRLEEKIDIHVKLVFDWLLSKERVPRATRRNRYDRRRQPFSGTGGED